MTSDFADILAQQLEVLYPAYGSPADLATQAIRAIGGSVATEAVTTVRPAWSETDVAVIAYGDSIVDDHKPPLRALGSFVDDRLSSIVSMIHVLPFFPYSSDDGFSVIDFAKVRADLGDWTDIGALGHDYRLMADLVVNHTSASSEWFRQFQADELPGREYFVTADPSDDLSTVVRPRTSPLLRPVETPTGTRHVWATFSHDQLDLDFSNPEMLFEFLRFIDLYLSNGVRAFRLDAVGYLWKEVGTTSIHLPQTHLVVKLIRQLLVARQPDALLITETNVPHAENVSYFGTPATGDPVSGEEAHLVYNFTMPPLVLQAMMAGSSTHLQSWIGGLEPLRAGTSFFNFLASHDGIGLRPTEGILSTTEVNELAATVRRAGGLVSMFTGPDGTDHPYELNISLFEAMRFGRDGIDDGLQVERFCAAHAIMLAFVGLPAFYIHSLLASPNDLGGVAATGENRSINRSKISRTEIDRSLDTPASAPAMVLARLTQLTAMRTSSSAFHPEASQMLLDTPSSVLGLRRTGSNGLEGGEPAETVDVFVNVTATRVAIPIEGEWEYLDSDESISGKPVSGELALAPYGSGWIRRR